MTTTRLAVPDISCGHCERTVLATLSPLDGVADVQVDIPTHTVTLSYDPAQITIDQISEALAREEYPVASVEDVRAS